MVSALCLILSLSTLIYFTEGKKPTIPVTLQECGKVMKTNDNDVVYYNRECRFIDNHGGIHIQSYEKDPFNDIAQAPKGKEFMVENDVFAKYNPYIFFLFMMSIIILVYGLNDCRIFTEFDKKQDAPPQN